jgi:hypothetical protein
VRIEIDRAAVDQRSERFRPARCRWTASSSACLSRSSVVMRWARPRARSVIRDHHPEQQHARDRAKQQHRP